MPTYRHGRHEYGQNFLTDQSIIATITRLVVATEGPIVEIGPGDGALTIPLARLGRPVTAIEIDARLARCLSERLPSHAGRRFRRLPDLSASDVSPCARRQPTVPPDHSHASTHAACSRMDKCNLARAMGGRTAKSWPWRCNDDDGAMGALVRVHTARPRSIARVHPTSWSRRWNPHHLPP